MAETSLNSDSTCAERLHFGPFTLDIARAELRRDGAVVLLRPKTFALLTAFAGRPGRVVSKDELLAAVWPGVVVTDDALTQCVHELRGALGDAGSTLVRTVARRGYRFDADVTAASTATLEHVAPSAAEPSTPGRWSALPGRRVPAAALLLLVVAIGAALLWWRSERPSRPASPPLSILVLPLATDEPHRWFADVLGSDLTTELGQLSGTLVISRETAATYLGKAVDPRSVARELGVRYVVSGSLRRESARVLLQLSLIDGESGALRWVDRFDLPRADLPASLVEVARRMARSLSVEMYRASGAAAARLSPEQVQADDLAMQGFASFFSGLTPNNLREARQRFEAAVAMDTNSVRGWGGIAAVAGNAGQLAWQPRDEALRQLQQAAERLQELDRQNYYTFMAQSFIAFLSNDWHALLLVNTATIERFPSHPGPYNGSALALAAFGRFSECIDAAQRAVRLGPLDWSAAIANAVTAICHFMREEYREAVRFARLAQQANPRLPSPPVLLAAALARTGEEAEARAIVADYLQRHPNYQASDIGKFLRGSDPRFIEGRDRVIETLRAIGMR